MPKHGAEGLFASDRQLLISVTSAGQIASLGVPPYMVEASGSQTLLHIISQTVRIWGLLRHSNTRPAPVQGGPDRTAHSGAAAIHAAGPRVDAG